MVCVNGLHIVLPCTCVCGVPRTQQTPWAVPYSFIYKLLFLLVVLSVSLIKIKTQLSTLKGGLAIRSLVQKLILWWQRIVLSPQGSSKQGFTEPLADKVVAAVGSTLGDILRRTTRTQQRDISTRPGEPRISGIPGQQTTLEKTFSSF